MVIFRSFAAPYKLCHPLPLHAAGGAKTALHGTRLAVEHDDDAYTND